MKFNGETIKFNIYDDMKYPSDVSYVYSEDIIDSLSQKYFNLCHDDKLNIVFYNNFEMNSLKIL